MSRSSLASVAGIAVLLAGTLVPVTAGAVASPTLAPKDGAWVSGTVDVESMPGDRGDRVTGITVDGKPLAATATEGTSTLRFGVGSNSIEGRYGSYFEVNGDAGQRIALDEPEYVDGTFDVAVPNEWLRQGRNEIRLQVGTFHTDCGTNYDDFEIFDVELSTGGPVTPSDDNRAGYNMGDGSCGSNTTLLTEATLAFDVGDDPRATVGLEGKLDSTTLSDGEHELVATTQQGGRTAHTVRVNNGDAAAPQLNVADGDTLSGDALVYATGGDGTESVKGYKVDDKAVDAQRSGGDGTAAFVFDIGSNASEARFGNAVVVNGQRIPLTKRDLVSERARVEFPAAYLRQGENTVQVETGTVQSGCGTNHDDFTISNLALEGPGLTATGRDLQPSYAMGDGNCGDNDKKLRSATATFDADVTEGSLSAVIDTTGYPDGTHTVTVVTEGGATLTRTVTFDNGGPQLTSSTPAKDARITEPVTLAASFEDISGVDEHSLKVTLDGAPVRLGDSIGAGLAAGHHELAFDVADKRGTRRTTTVVFSSAAIPAGTVQTSSKHDGGATHTLSATVVEDGDTSYDTTFHLAKANTPTGGTEGTSVEIPTTLNPSSESMVDLDKVRRTDGATDRSPAAQNTSWQRFDIAVGEQGTGSRVQWDGDVDPQREVHLLVWDHKAGHWDELAVQRGKQDGTALAGTVREQHVRDGVVNAMVAATDPFADDMKEPVDGSFEDPEDYDFSIAHLTDTQYLSEGAAGDYRLDNTGLHPKPERDLWYNAYADVWRWVTANADKRKIAYAAHTGDIIENNIRHQVTKPMRDKGSRGFAAASEIQEIIEESGIPHGVLAGNHDNVMGTDASQYNEHFGPSRYEEVSKRWRDDASYGGGWKPGDNENHYDLFSAGGLDFVAVHLSYGIDDEDIRWANEVLQRYSDRNALLFTHAYLTTSSEPDGRDAPYSNAGGRDQARKIVEKNPNVVMTISGHHHGVGINVRKDGGQVGNHFLEMLADYQFYEVPVTHPKLQDLRANYKDDKTLRFGSSFFRLLQFDVDRGELVINSYSPFLDEFGAHEYDLEHRYDGTEDELRVPIQLTSRTTSLATDSFAVYTPTDTVLGTATAKANEAATTTVDFGTVPGLPAVDGLPVGWIAIARNASGGTVTSAFNLLTVNRAPTGEDPDGQEPGEPGPSEPAPSEPAPGEPGPSSPAPGGPATPGDPSPSAPGPQRPGEGAPSSPAKPGPRPGLPATGR